MVCLVAAASRRDLNDWKEFAGGCLVELAFGNLEDDDGKVLLSHMRCVLHAVPELWASCAEADAALMGYNACILVT